jgi:endonuclease/exonuclease/phosphatase family metal-dependent hydrolase
VKKMMKLGIALNVGVALLLLFAYLSPYIHPRHFSLPAITSLLYPFLFIANIIFLLLWISFRKSFFLISLFCLIVGWNHHGRFIQFSIDNPKTTDASRALKIMTFNLRWLRHVPPADQSKIDDKISNLAAKIREATGQLDFLCLQEGTLGEKIGTALDLPYAVKADKISIWLLSKHPVLKHGTISGKSKKQKFALWADLRVRQDTFRVFTLHLQSNKITSEAEELMEDIRFQEKATWIQLKDILSKYRMATAIRADQALILQNVIESSPFPVIVCGDFNDTPQSNAYQVIAENLNDSFVEVGSGIGTTYAGHLPALRIDYVLSSTEFNNISHEVLDWDYSDHFPVITEFEY